MSLPYESSYAGKEKVMAFDQKNQDATIYVGNLDERVDDEILWELFTQCGPVASVSLPKDRVSGTHQGFGFVEFRLERDAEYASKIMSMIKVFDKNIKVNKSSHGSRSYEIGANLFIGNLDDTIDEQLLYQTFSNFGGMAKDPKIIMDQDTGKSRGFGLLFFDSFDASDLAIQCMNGQFLGSKQISVQYAFKKDSNGQRHGSQAERALAKELQAQRGAPAFQPNTLFATGNDMMNAQPPPALAYQQPMQMMQPPAMAPPPPPSNWFFNSAKDFLVQAVAPPMMVPQFAPPPVPVPVNAPPPPLASMMPPPPPLLPQNVAPSPQPPSFPPPPPAQ